MQVTFYGATDIGRVRTNNEDVFIAQKIWDNKHILLVAIDGMGGEEGGEIAAEIARNTIIDYLSAVRDNTPLNLIKAAVAEANNEIVRAKSEQPQYQRMGCVATAGIIDLAKHTLSIAHVGDSRLYRYSKGDLRKLTHDHSLVGYQEEQGILSEEEAMKHPRRSVIERCLGIELHTPDDRGFIEAGIFPLINGEKFLFCSDGLSDVLTSAEIASCLSSEATPEQECAALIDKANAAGGKDNITVVIAHIGSCTDEALQKVDVPAFSQSPDETNDDTDATGLQSQYIETKKRKLFWTVLLTALISAAAGFAACYFFFPCPIPTTPEPAQQRIVRPAPPAASTDTVPSDTIVQSSTL
ncbi:MAG: protein phosphatase 2C domain-containing protein [Prevotella sp.]|nr:protein phosphatase 2C domain-containing protein [Prevotella sp.]MCM1074126.1 protein phosphatase 2C domain-containing protein [Ruminococcus sp.]